MRYYTPETATRTLPLIRRIVDDLLELQVDLVFRGDRIDALTDNEGRSASRAHADELADMRLSLQRDRGRIDAVMAELGRLGVSMHPAVDGTVDFPAYYKDREVRLCWQPGENAVQYWHEVDESASKRRPIKETSDFSIPVSQESSG